MNHNAAKTRSSLGRLLLILAMTIALVAGTALIGAQGAKAEGDNDSGNTQGTATSSDPVSKTVTSNDDGTYTVKLSAQGQSSSTSSSNTAEVVVVMDISGSMNNAIEPATYQKITGNPEARREDYYGLVNGNYVQLYYYNGKYCYYDDYYYYYTNSDFYTKRTRLDVAKESTIRLVKQLLDNNTSAHPNAVTVKLVTFNKTASQATELNSSNYQSVINGLKANEGTNWEDGLSRGQFALNNSSADSKNIIFVSDGNPTYWVNDRWGTVDGTGYENEINISNSYNQANPVAQDIVQKDINLYKVGVFGDVSRMQGLGTGASNPTGSLQYYSATNQKQLEAAFANIINSITNSFTLNNIQFSDGITNLTSVQKLSTDASKVDFTYKRNNKEEKSGSTSGTIPAASYENGTITWNPTANGAISDGVTYSVECTIWPSKSAYQQVANAKNSGSDTGLASQNISKDEKGNYYLDSNTSSSTVSYDEVHTTTSSDATVLGVTQSGGSYSYNGTSLTLKDGKYQSSDGNIVLEKTSSGWTLTEKKTLNLGSGKMKVEPAVINITKKWQNVTDQPESITVKAESTTKGDDTSSYSTTLNKPTTGSGDWTGKLYVAPGLNDGTTDLNSRTTYKITEDNVDAGTYSVTYNPTDQTYTPVINGTTAPDPYNITITNTKIIKTGIRTENRAPFTAAAIGLGALAAVFVVRRRFTHR